MEHAVALMVGIIALPLGLSLFFRPAEWARWLQIVRTQGAPLTLMLGYFHLMVGAFIVAFHWQWEGLAVVVTLIGVAALLEGLVYVLFPQCLQTLLAWYEPRQKGLFRLLAVGAVLIALISFGEYFQALPIGATR